MFEPAVAAILAHHDSKSGHFLMRQTAERALQRGYRLIPPGGSGQAKYLRLVLDAQPPGIPVTLYLQGDRLVANGKQLRPFAASLPGAVTTNRDVQFPLGSVGNDVLDAFAAWAAAGAAQPAEAPGGGSQALAAVPADTATAPMSTPASAPKGRPRPPWENQPAADSFPLPPAVGAPTAGSSAWPAAGAASESSPRQRKLIIAAVCAAVFLVVVAAAGGFGSALILAGLAVLAVGVVALVRGRAAWARIPSRGVGGAVAAGGLVLFIAGGALAPTPTTPSAQEDAALGATETAGPSSPSEADIAAAEASLVEAETSERPNAGVDSTTGLLSDDAAQAAVESAERTTALAALAAVEVKGRAPRTGYDRDLFGDGWVDVDRNGCDTRNDILARDLTGESFKPGTRNCVVLTGTLADPYSGRSIAFTRGQDTSDDVQIDHVVALSDAWQKGAQGWDTARRTQFANDPLNLLAVDGPLNMQKGDGDAATWLPPNRSYRCPYVARQVAVKATYALWMTQAEKNAIATVLTACPNEPLPAGVVVDLPEEEPDRTPAPPQNRAPVPVPVPVDPPNPAPAPAPIPAPAPAPAPAPEPEPEPAPSAYYPNCDAARAAGVAPIQAGEPGYRPGLDRDGDGTACDS